MPPTRRRSNRMDSEEVEEEEEEFQQPVTDAEEDEEDAEDREAARPGRRGRPRGRGGRASLGRQKRVKVSRGDQSGDDAGESADDSSSIEDESLPLFENNHSTVLPEEPPVEFEGDDCMDPDGNPKGGRELKCKSFLLPDRHPSRRFVLILDLARSLGWTDSFRFLKDNRRVPRINITPEEKEMLIENKLAHPILRKWDVPVLSVVYAYKLFRSKMLRVARKSKDPSELLALEQQQYHSQNGIMDGGDFFYQRPLKRSDALLAAETEDEEEGGRRRRSKAPSSKVAKVHTTVAEKLEQKKPPLEVEVVGGDWMFRCALSAAEFNSQLRLERADRLWGWTPGDDESDEEEEDDFMEDLSDSDSEAGIGKPKRKNQPKRLPQKRNGFYDVHTRIHQVPSASQLSRVDVHSAGLRTQDLIRAGKMDRASLAKEEVEKTKLRIGEKVIIEPVHGISPVVQFGVGGRGLEDSKKYPLALLPNQYQGFLSIHSTRFGSLVPPQFPAGNLNAAQPGLPPRSALQLPAPASKGPVMNVSSSLSSAGPTLGRERRRGAAPMPVQSSNVSTRSSPPPSPEPENAVCAQCSESIRPENMEPKELLGAGEMIHYDCISCMRCFQYFHFKCLDVPHTARIQATMRTYDWMCVDCKRCEECDDIKTKEGDGEEEEEELLFCDGCDRGYHVSCLDMKDVPDGAWLCNVCAKCRSCGQAATPPENNDLKLHVVVAPRDVEAAKEDKPFVPESPRKKGRKKAREEDEEENEASNETATYLTSLCERCLTDWNLQCYCPTCLKTYPDPSANRKQKEEKEMVACKSCERRVHFPDCDPQMFSQEDGRKYIDDDSVEYTCPACRMSSQKEKICEKKDGNHPIVAELVVDSDDEDQIQRTHAIKHRPRRRGRPPARLKFADQLAQEQKLKAEYDRENEQRKKPLRARDVVLYRGKLVVVPFLRQLKRWSEVWLNMK